MKNKTIIKFISLLMTCRKYVAEERFFLVKRAAFGSFLLKAKQHYTQQFNQLSLSRTLHPREQKGGLGEEHITPPDITHSTVYMPRNKPAPFVIDSFPSHLPIPLPQHPSPTPFPFSLLKLRKQVSKTSSSIITNDIVLLSSTVIDCRLSSFAELQRMNMTAPSADSRHGCRAPL